MNLLDLMTQISNMQNNPTYRNTQFASPFNNTWMSNQQFDNLLPPSKQPWMQKITPGFTQEGQQTGYDAFWNRLTQPGMERSLFSLMLGR